MKVFSIDGYFQEDGEEIGGLLITDFDEVPDGYSDEDIFFYSIGEHEIQQAIRTKQPVDDFIITDYSVESEV